MDLYQRMSDRSMAKLYWIARHCGDFATANEILQALRQRIELGAERAKRFKVAAQSPIVLPVMSSSPALAGSRCTSHYVRSVCEHISHEQRT